MSKFFIIPENAYDGFLALIEMGPEKLESFSAILSGQELTLNTSDLVKKLSQSIEFPLERLQRAIYAVILPLNRLRVDFRISEKEFLELVANLIARQNVEWSRDHGEDWNKIAPHVSPLLAPNGYFAQLSKAFQLLSNRPIVVQNLKIVTELRPVFDDEVSTIKAMVLTSTLIVEYEENEKSKSIHLTVDESDLRILQEQLDRAQNKIQLLEKQTDALGVPFLIPGAERE